MQSDIFPVAPLPVAAEAVPPGAMEGGNALRRVQDSHGFATAITVQLPRDLATVEVGLLEEARLLGERAYYGWGAGKDKIEGPSIELAMALFNHWGNNALDALPIQETEDAWIFTAAHIDLQRGSTVTRQFRMSKSWTVYGKMDAARKEDVRFQIGASKAARNVILNALPKWLIDRALEVAKAGVRENIERFIVDKGIDAARKAILVALKKETVSEERVLAKVGRAAVGGLTVDDLVILRGNLAALMDGADSADSLFPQPEAEPTDDLRKRLTKKPKAKKPEAEPAPEPPATGRGRPRAKQPEAEQLPLKQPAEDGGSNGDKPELLVLAIGNLWVKIPLGQRGTALENVGVAIYPDIAKITDIEHLRSIHEAFLGEIETS